MNICQRTPIAVSKILPLLAGMLLAAASSFAASFTSGDLVVLEAVSGSANNTTAAILEVNPNTSALVQTISIPSTGANAFRISGSAGSAGALVNSADFTLISFNGANNTTSSGSTNKLNPRGAGVLNAAGTFSIPATYTGVSGNIQRDAVTLDDNTWYLTDAGGIYTNGGANPVNSSANGLATLPLRVFGGVVYGVVPAGTSSVVASMSTGSGFTLTSLPGLASDTTASDFYMYSSGNNGTAYDVIYTIGSSGITKYSLVSGSWTSNGVYNNASVKGFGIVAVPSGPGATLYVTGAGATNNALLSVVDTAGWNSGINVTASPGTLFTSTGGALLKGVAFVPVPVTISAAGTLAALSTNQGTASSPTSFSVQAVNLTSNLVVTPPAGFEVSTSSGSGYGATVTLMPSSGTVGATTVFVRLAAATAPGTYSGNVICSSSGVPSVYVLTAPSTVNAGATISVSGTLTAVSTTYGTPSSSTSFSASGTSLTANLTVTPPNGFEVSTSSGSGYGPTVTLAPSSGTVPSTPIFVRLTATATPPGSPYSGNVVVSGGGSNSPKSVAMPASTVSPFALTVSGAAVTTKPYDGTTAATITGTLVGVISPDVVNLVGTGNFASANSGSGIAVTSACTLSGSNAGNYTVTQPTGLSGTIIASDNLGGLTLSSGTLNPTFVAGTNSYTASVSNGVTSITLTPTVDTTATATINVNGSQVTGPISLSVGQNTITVVVTEGGSSQTYTFVITRAAPFTLGNLVVQQADNGSLQNTTITLVEVSTTGGANQSDPVQTIQLPGTNTASTPPQALRINGSGGTTGYLATTNDGTFLAVAAADALNSTDLGQTSAASIANREVVTLDSMGNLVFQASYTGDNPTSGEQCRGATSPDNSNWFVAEKGGIYVCSVGSSPNTADSTSNMLNARSFGGVIYGLTASSLSTVASSGAHIGALTSLPGIPTSLTYTDFYLISSGVNGAGFDVCYICNGASATSGTIYKYSLVGGTWMNNVNSGGTWAANGSYTTTFGGRSMAAAGAGSGAALYLTAGNGSTSGVSVVQVTDTTSFDQTINVVTANNVNLYTFAGGTTGPVPKGIAFTPVASALPDLTISASLPTNPYFAAGNQFSYTLTLANSGTANATGVTAQFTLPAGLTYVGATDNGGSATNFVANNNNGVISFTGGTLNAGTTDAITVNVSGTTGSYTVDAGLAPASGHGSAVINTLATTATPIVESNSANNSSTIQSVAVIGTVPDLIVSVTGSSTAVADSSVNDITYTITVQNIGNTTATNASVQLTLPAGLSYLSANDTGSAGFTSAFNSGVVTFSGGTLASNAMETLTVTAIASTSTYRIFSVTLPAGAAVVTAGNMTGSNASSGSVATSVSLPNGPDFVVSSTPNGPFLAGDDADTYTIYVSNDGTTSTDGSTVTLTMTLPTGLTPAASMNGATINGWLVSVGGQVVTATRSNVLAVGTGYPALIVTVAVASNATGALVDTLSVAGGGDAFLANNSAMNTVNIGAPAPISSSGYLLVSRAHYVPVAITAGSTILPNGAVASDSGAYAFVWGNEEPDVSFGVTAPFYFDKVDKISGSVISSTNLTALISTQLGVDLTTSFSSKSELGLTLTPDQKGVTFSGYIASADTLDVSNANTPYHDDPTSPLAGHGDYQKGIVQVDYLGNVQVTPNDSYSGDNCRAAILAQAGDGNSYYYTVGSAGNSGAGVTGATMTMLAQCTGVQMVLPGAGGLMTAVGFPFGTAGSTTGYQLGYQGLPSDKTGKDMNLRAVTLNPFNQTLYVSKGSGGNGVDTVYQIGSGGLPTAANANTIVFTVASGFPTTNNGSFPFGLWFANASTLYVGDEGQANVPTPSTYSNGVYTQAVPANNPKGGLQKWINSQPDGSGTWTLAYTINSGLNLGVPFAYSIANYPTGVNPATGVPWQPANNGLRNIAGQVNGDGTVTIYALTATVSGETDQGADPNQLVSITDDLSAASLPPSESFSVVEVANGPDVLRGVAIAPAPPAPDLAVRLTHTGAFTQGDAADACTITIINPGNASSTGTVTISGTLPVGLVPAASNNGTINGWNVSVSGQTVTATRTDAVAPSSAFPSLLITVSVGDDAPASVVNTASVSGGGESYTGNNAASDTISIGLSALNTWRQTFFPGSTSTSGPGADDATPENDGVSNLIKFATGMDPTVPGTMPGGLGVDGGNLTFTYTPATSAVTAGFDFVVEYNDALGSGTWASDIVNQGTIGAGGSPVTATVPFGPDGQRFLHLRIVKP